MAEGIVTAQGRGRRGGRAEPPGGWRLGTKTSAPPESGLDEEPTPEEAARQDAADALAAKRRSDRMARQDDADLRLERHHVSEGRSPFKTRETGQEPRSPFGGDPAEERRNAAKAMRGESSSVWVQDSRAGYYRESWEERDAERLGNEGEAAVAELRKAVRGGLEELVRVRTVVLADRFTASAAEMERLEGQPRQDDDGRRANRRDRAAVVADGLPLAPPLGRALVCVEADPALVALAAGRYLGAELEPPLRQEWLQGPGRADVAIDSVDVIERALEDVEAAHAARWRDDPGGAAAIERRWEREREALWEAASGSPAPEEARLLVEGMREYAAELTETVRGVGYVARLHTAVGRDLESSPIGADVVDRALDRYPDLVEGIRAVDPDSPLCVAPAGAGPAYGRLLERALDGVRPLVVDGRESGAPLSSEMIRARVTVAVAEAVEALERSPDRGHERSPSAPPPGAGVSAVADERRLEERLAQADVRFEDFVDALEARGVRFEVDSWETGIVRPSGSGAVVELSVDAFGVEERWVDGQRKVVPLPVGSLDERREAVAGAMRGVSRALTPREGFEPEPVPGAGERFGARMAARVFDEALPVPDRASGAAEAAAARLASDLGAEAADAVRRREEWSAARAAGLERFEQVLDGVGGSVAVAVREQPFGDYGPGAEYRVARDRDSGRLAGTVVVDARYVSGDPRLSNEELATGHGEAYVAMGRALGAVDREARGEDWSKVYGAVASTVASGGAVAVDSVSCALDPAEHAALGKAKAYAAALREQVRADGFATEQMKRAWPREWRESTSRRVERVAGQVEVDPARLAVLGARSRVEPVLARDGKRLAEDVGRLVGGVEKLARRAAREGAPVAVPENPATPPSLAQGTAEARDRAASYPQYSGR